MKKLPNLLYEATMKETKESKGMKRRNFDSKNKYS